MLLIEKVLAWLPLNQYLLSLPLRNQGLADLILQFHGECLVQRAPISDCHIDKQGANLLMRGNTHYIKFFILEVVLLHRSQRKTAPTR